MALLTTKQRNNMKSSTFALPEERKYPINDRAHAANAKSRAATAVKEGHLSKAKEKKVDRKADKLLYGSSKPKSKKK